MTLRPLIVSALAVGLIAGGSSLALAHGSGGGSGGQPYGWNQGMMMYPGMMGQGQMPPCMMMNHGMMGQGQMGPGMMSHGMMSHGQMGPGMMMNPGMMGQGQMGHGMMGHGQMGPGMMMNPGMMGQGQMGQREMQPLRDDLTADDVRHVMGHRLAWQGNPNIQLGKVEERDEDTIVAEIVTKDGSLVQRLEVDRHTGWMQAVQ